MQSRFLTHPAAALVSIIGSAHATAAATPGDVRVEVATLHNAKGRVLCTLFDSQDAYKQLRPVMRLSVEPTKPITICVFHDVGAGVYMISAVHDENDNGKLDKNFFGMPTEGYGVSNNHTYATKGPAFKESAVTLGDGLKTIAIQLHYPGAEPTP
jgi:uncharacterized protein (DUF2141 family)